MSVPTTEITLPSGMVIEPPFGIVGIDCNGAVFAGYDEEIWNPEYADDVYMNTPLSPADRAALADVMIERWQKFKADALK